MRHELLVNSNSTYHEEGSPILRIIVSDNLEVMRFIPMAYCHELTGNRKGQLSVKLDQGYRMIFEPANDPLPRKIDGGLDWSKVTVVRILKISEDYHG